MRAIRLRVLEERSREEVARELEVTPATFDVVLHRAMQALRKTLGAPPETKRSAKREGAVHEASPKGEVSADGAPAPPSREAPDV
jgi:RNA polymerase sigma-70 factor (ECF subfamily)